MPVEGSDRTWLPCAYDPVWFAPSPIPWRERRQDVSLVGVPSADRNTVVEALARRPGLTVGYGRGKVYDEFRDISHDTRISLVVSRCGDVPMRVFETAAMGCQVVTDPLTDLNDLGAGGIVVYRSPEEAVEKIESFLAHPEEALSQVAQSQSWALPHTWDARAQTICAWFRSRLS